MEKGFQRMGEGFIKTKSTCSLVWKHEDYELKGNQRVAWAENGKSFYEKAADSWREEIQSKKVYDSKS